MSDAFDPDPGAPPASAPTEAEQVDANGVDLTLVRHTLSLSPTERLKAVENYLNAVSTVRVVR